MVTPTPQFQRGITDPAYTAPMMGTMTPETSKPAAIALKKAAEYLTRSISEGVRLMLASYPDSRAHEYFPIELRPAPNIDGAIAGRSKDVLFRSNKRPPIGRSESKVRVPRGSMVVRPATGTPGLPHERRAPPHPQGSSPDPGPRRNSRRTYRQPRRC